MVISRIKARELELNTSKKPGNNLFAKGKFGKKNNTVMEINLGVLGIRVRTRKRKGNKNLSGSVIIVEKGDTLRSITMIF